MNSPANTLSWASTTQLLKEVPLRHLADPVAPFALFDRIGDGKLIDLVREAHWSSPGRRQYAVSCAARIEQHRLRRRVFRAASTGDVDQVIPLHKTGATAPSSVRAAARKLQEIAVRELRTQNSGRPG